MSDTQMVTGPWYARVARVVGLALLRWSRRHGARWVLPDAPADPPEPRVLKWGGVLQRRHEGGDILEAEDGRILMPRPHAFSRPLDGAPYCEYGWWVPGTEAQIIRQLMPEPRHQESRRVDP